MSLNILLVIMSAICFVGLMKPKMFAIYKDQPILTSEKILFAIAGVLFAFFAFILTDWVSLAKFANNPHNFKHIIAPTVLIMIGVAGITTVTISPPKMVHGSSTYTDTFTAAFVVAVSLLSTVVGMMLTVFTH